MPGRTSLIEVLESVHAGQQLYTLVAEEASGARELWDEIGQVQLNLLGGSALEPGQALMTVKRLRDRCKGPLGPLRGVFEGLLGTLEREPWE